jgi:hypothetical protein
MNREVALEQVGEGWSGLVNSYYGFLDVLSCALDADRKPDIEVQTVEVSRGMLRIVAEHPNAVMQDILDKLAWAIERDSAKVCEVCGEKGFRRKTLEGEPNRCQPHYIELLNRLADEGKI